MHPKVIKAVRFLKTCTTKELREMLKGNPDTWKVHFKENSQEYGALVYALKSNVNCNSSSRRNPITAPTAVKLVNKF